MDGIQPYSGAPRPVPHVAHPSHIVGFGHSSSQVATLDTAPAKTPADYLRAIKRRSWLVVSIGVLISVVGALLVLRMPAVYRAEAQMTIEPPRYDPYLSAIISKTERGLIRTSAEETEKYVPDKLAMLRSKALIDKVVRDPSLTGGQAIGPLDDPSTEISKNLYTRNLPGTHFYTVSLEGGDASKVTRTLHLLLEEFRNYAQTESRDVLEESKRHAKDQLELLEKELARYHKDIYELALKSTAIGPGGVNLPKERYQELNHTMTMERANYSALQRELRRDSLHPTQTDPRSESRANRVASLQDEKRMLEKRLRKGSETARHIDDPALRSVRNDIQDIDAKLEAQRKPAASDELSAGDDSESILAAAREEIHALEKESNRVMGEMQQSLPEYDKYENLVFQREQKQKQMAAVAQNLNEFDALAKTQKDPVKITVPPVEPVMPDRPKRGLYIAGLIVFGFLLGAGYAFLLEHVDHSVKVPEHLTLGLSLPLLGVIPRIKRTAKIHRGGHLWTPGSSDSIEADAYRNIRASLLGVAGSHGPIVTLLVTSAKAGEGKSTTALNLAATCARAGERTLLVDVDLRRPSLAEVFPHEDGHLGLVDVLRGDLPWQRVVVASELPNLDFIPTGDTRDVPIEILGSLELRQLLLSLSQHHYDRVILDGPAILGLADCRMLGRIVDAAIMVVRSGAIELRPLRRAKAMLEQSQVTMAGLVFNGLADDLDNWSSYGPTPSFGTPGSANGPARGIEDAALAHTSLDA